MIQYFIFFKGKYDGRSRCNKIFSFRENLQNLKVCQICNLIWQHASQFIVVKVSVRQNLAVSKDSTHHSREKDEFGSMLYFYIQISQGRETIPIADKIPESACQVVVANITAKGEFIICNKPTTSHRQDGYNRGIEYDLVYLLKKNSFPANKKQKEPNTMFTGDVGSLEFQVQGGFAP